MSQEKDVGLLTNNPQVKKRVIEICEQYGFEYSLCEDLDQFAASPIHCKVLVACIETPEGQLSAPELAQVVRFSVTDAYLICVIAGSMPKEDAVFAKRSGANLVILEDEVANSSKLDYIVSQIIQANFLPIKVSDLKVGTTVNFDIYHLLPQRKKFLQTIFAGDLVEEAKLKKAVGVNELYIHRGAAIEFKKYIEEQGDLSAAGIDRRCRSQFLALVGEFSTMVFQLTNLSEHASFGEGQTLLKQCSSLCAELMGTLAAAGEAWAVVNNSAIGTFGSVERAPAVAAYAGLLGLRMGWKFVDEIMLVALLSDLGLLVLPAEILNQYRDRKELSGPDLERFKKYPTYSVDIILNRKLSLAEKQRAWVSSARERYDGKGYPKGLLGDRLNKEARLVAFCREFDQRTLVRLGQPRLAHEVVLKRMLTEEPENADIYGPDLLRELAAASFEAPTNTAPEEVK